jgi:hypothetical protein
MLRHLRGLTYLDLSHLMRGGSSSTSSSTLSNPQHSQQLLALLQGLATPQFEQQHEVAGAASTATAVTAPSSTSSSSSSGRFFSSLQHLECIDSALQFSEQLWVHLKGLRSLNLSGSVAFRGAGLAQLQLLQRLVLKGEVLCQGVVPECGARLLCVTHRHTIIDWGGFGCEPVVRSIKSFAVCQSCAQKWCEVMS